MRILVLFIVAFLLWLCSAKAQYPTSTTPVAGDTLQDSLRRINRLLNEVHAPTQPTRSTALEAGRILKGSAGTLITLVGHNAHTSDQYIQLHNSAGVAAEGAVPEMTFLVPAGTSFSLNYQLSPLRFITGIYVCNSSTAATKTIGSATCFFSAQVK